MNDIGSFWGRESLILLIIARVPMLVKWKQYSVIHFLNILVGFFPRCSDINLVVSIFLIKDATTGIEIIGHKSQTLIYS